MISTVVPRRSRRAGLILSALSGGLVLLAAAVPTSPAPPANARLSATSLSATGLGAVGRIEPLTAAGPLTAESFAAERSAAGPGTPNAPDTPSGPKGPGRTADPSVTVSVPGQSSRVVQVILLLTVLGVAPAVLLMCTSFTKIVVVLSLTRSALGTPSIPPNQVLVGLAMFLSLFVMGPTLDAMQTKGVTPYTNGTKTATQAYRDASTPLRGFMLKHTRDEDLALMTKAAGKAPPKDRATVDLRTLIPAFVLSELRGAFIIGFVVFMPFLVIDIVVSAILMSLGMVMLPPSLVSLPFKLLLFVLVDGWSLIVTTLLGTYR
jgi:flagellar biosynthetic protein FliP